MRNEGEGGCVRIRDKLVKVHISALVIADT
jgi:hypothetical protein